MAFGTGPITGTVKRVPIAGQKDDSWLFVVLGKRHFLEDFFGMNDSYRGRIDSFHFGF
jgi:hypothetical protein